jgi:serine/threonine protein kinase
LFGITFFPKGSKYGDYSKGIYMPIAKKTVFSELKFNHKSWPLRSLSSKDFILKAMTKDLDKRAKIADLIKHQWFVDCGIISGKKQSSTKVGTIFQNKFYPKNFEIN